MLIRDGEKGWEGGMEVGEEGDYIPIAIHCHHQNDSCIKVGSDESHFNVAVGIDGQSHKTVSTAHDFLMPFLPFVYGYSSSSLRPRFSSNKSVSTLRYTLSRQVVLLNFLRCQLTY